MPTRIITGEAARATVYRSLARSVHAVSTTLGPSGRAVITERGIVADGLSVAREVSDSEGANSIGARLVRDTLFDAERDLGDGTARLACILGETVRAGLRSVAAGVPAGTLADEMILLQDTLQDHLQDECCPAHAPGAVAHSAGADAEILTLLDQLSPPVLEGGSVELRPSHREARVTSFGDGFIVDTQPEAVGFSAGERSASLAFESVNVLVVNEIIEDFAEFARILEGFVARDKSLCIVARGFGPTARATLTANRKGLRLRLIGLMPGDVGERAFGILEDLALATGATLIGRELGISLASTRPAMLGRAAGLHFAGERAAFVAPAGDRDAIAARSEWLLAEADRQRFLSLDREHLRRRAARLTGTWAEIEIPDERDAASRLRLREGRAAISALRAARTGVVAGGGVALSRVADRIARETVSGSSPARRMARHVVAQGCRVVSRRISANAGLVENAPFAALPGRPYAGQVFDASLRRFRPLVDWPVVDPLLTTAELLRRAVSAAATILRIEVLVCA